MSVGEYAKKIKLSEWYIRKLCRDGKLNSLRIGNEWIIENK